MKKFIVMLLCFSVYAQPEKDSLLAKDIEKVKSRIEVMLYLERIVTTNYLAKPVTESVSYDFEEYYKDSILVNNPKPSVTINEHLGFKEGYVPPSWNYFAEPVWQKNAEHLLEIIKNYGYPSVKRIYNTVGPKSTVVIIVERAPDKYKDMLWPLLRKEYRLGNMPEADYEFCRFFIKNRGTIPFDELMKFQKKMEKLGVKYKGTTPRL